MLEDSVKTNSYLLLMYSLPLKMKYRYLSSSHEEFTRSYQLDPLSELHFMERQVSLQRRPCLPSKETWDTTFMYRKSENITDFVWTSLFFS